MILSHPLGVQFPSLKPSSGLLGCCAIFILEPSWNILKTIRISPFFTSDWDTQLGSSDTRCEKWLVVMTGYLTCFFFRLVVDCAKGHVLKSELPIVCVIYSVICVLDVYKST